MNPKMIDAAESALKEVLLVQPNQNFLIITDEAKKAIGNAFARAAEKLDLRTTFFILPENNRPLKKIPEELLALIPSVDVASTIFRGIAEETPFRVQLIKEMTKFCKRLGHAPGITEAMMLEGPMNVNYQEMIETAKKLMELFINAKAVHITSPGGTDVRIDIENRGWETDVIIPEHHFGNLPCGEIWCAPVEVQANGTIVCDGSIGDFGKAPRPLKLEVKYGKISSWECEDRAFGEKVYQALTIDDEADVIGELGIGINPGAKITGNLLEDEKALETIHIAFGNNESMPGGKNRSRTHRDFLVCKPDMMIHYRGGNSRRLLNKGKLLL